MVSAQGFITHPNLPMLTATMILTSSWETERATFSTLRTPAQRPNRFSPNALTPLIPSMGLFSGFWIGLDFADLNGDGNPDLVVGNTDGLIHYFENAGAQESPEFSPQSLPTRRHLRSMTIAATTRWTCALIRTTSGVYLRPEGISDVYGLTGNLVIARDTVIENFIAGAGTTRLPAMPLRITSTDVRAMTSSGAAAAMTSWKGARR